MSNLSYLKHRNSDQTDFEACCVMAANAKRVSLHTMILVGMSVHMLSEISQRSCTAEGLETTVDQQ